MRTVIWNDEEGTLDVLPECLGRLFSSSDPPLWAEASPTSDRAPGPARHSRLDHAVSGEV